MKSQFKDLIRSFENIKFNYFYIYVGRSLLALCTLIAIGFNDPVDLFTPTYALNPLYEQFTFSKISIFYLLSNHLFFAKFLSVIILLSVIIGLLPRITCFLHWWISYSFAAGSFIFDGGDQIAEILALLLIPILVTDDSFFQWNKKNKIRSFGYYKNFHVFAWLLIVQIQMCVLYFHSSIGKFSLTEWGNGTAVYYWFTDPDVGMPNYLIPFLLPLIKSSWGVMLISWGTLVIEFMLFLSFFIRKPGFNRSVLLLGILFHFSIGMVHGLWSFFFAMAGGLILYLSPIILRPERLVQDAAQNDQNRAM